MPRYEDEEVQVFNFSFLDILSCTIGALIFILLLFVLSTSELVEKTLFEEIKHKYATAQDELSAVEKLLAERREGLEPLRKEKEELAVKADELSQNLEDSKEELAKLESQRTELQSQLSGMEKRVEKIEKERTQLETRVEERGEIIDRLKSMLQSDTRIDKKMLEAMHGSKSVTTNKVDERRDKNSELMPNVEQRSIYCLDDSLYIQPLGYTVPLKSMDSDPVLNSFLRHIDPKNEKLLVVPMSSRSASYQKLQDYLLANSSQIGLEVRSRNAKVPPSLPGGARHVEADEDNDGRAETRYEDTDGDGQVDLKRVDHDGDGKYETVFSGYDRAAGKWTLRLVDVNLDGEPDELWIDEDTQNNTYEVHLIGVKQASGIARVEYQDLDGDGVWDAKLVDVYLEDIDYEEEYTDFDQATHKWKKKTVDSDGDGVADTLWVDTNTANDVWEEKYKDLDGDRQWDVKWLDVHIGDDDWEARFEDFDEKIGKFMKLTVDSDNDGAWDKVFRWDPNKSDYVEQETRP